MLFPALFALLQETTTAPAPAGPAGTGTPPAAGGDLFTSVLPPLLLCAVVFYIFMIGPERKQKKKRELMIASLQKGAKVMTTGGLYATVAQVQDQIVTLQIADGVRARYALSAIQTVIEDEKTEALKPA